MHTTFTKPLPAKWTAGEFDGSRAGKCAGVALAVSLGLGIVALQTAFVMTLSAMSGSAAETGIYESLCCWDGHPYREIAEYGYHDAPTGYSALKSNVAFFPGYPIAGRWLHTLSGGRLSFKASMVFTSQLAAWGFWSIWLLSLKQLGASRAIIAAATLLLVTHPAAFYLVVAYSESLFLLFAFGFLFLMTRQSRYGAPLAAICGMAATATRMGGVPVVLAPVMAQAFLLTDPAVRATFLDQRLRHQAGVAATLRAAFAGIVRLRAVRRDLLVPVRVAALSLLGVVAFFAFCQWQFSAWNLYMQTQRATWGVSADVLWWLRPGNYAFVGSLAFADMPWPDDLSRFTVLLSVIMFAVLARYEYKLAGQGDTSWQRRIVFYLAASGLFFLYAAGVSPISMKSMIRYSLGVYALLALALVQLPGIRAIEGLSRRQTKGIVALAAVMFIVQCALVWRFFTNAWVA